MGRLSPGIHRWDESGDKYVSVDGHPIDGPAEILNLKYEPNKPARMWMSREGEDVPIIRLACSGWSPNRYFFLPGLSVPLGKRVVFGGHVEGLSCNFRRLAQ